VSTQAGFYLLSTEPPIQNPIIPNIFSQTLTALTNLKKKTKKNLPVVKLPVTSQTLWDGLFERLRVDAQSVRFEVIKSIFSATLWR